MKNNRTVEILLLMLTAIEAAVAIFFLVQIPGGSVDAGLLGFSASRLAMIFFLLSFICISLVFLLRPHHFESILTHKRPLQSVGRLFPPFFFLISAVLLYTGFVNPQRFSAYFQRLLPPGIFLLAFTLQGFLFLRFIYTGIESGCQLKKMQIFRFCAMIFLIGCLIYILIRLTGLGMTVDPLDWQPNGMSIQYWQLFTALLIALVLAYTIYFLQTIQQIVPSLEMISFLLVWLFAAIIWVSVPTQKVLDHSYFMEITAPNDVPYPASDAAYFGLWSESVMAGLGFKGQVISRQLYVIALAFIQLICSKEIWSAINLGTIVLAMIPAAIFLLGKRLHSWGAGFLAAGIAILREWNSLWLAPSYGVSNSKMWLSDMPSLLLFVLFCACLINYLQNSSSKPRALVTGGLIGLAIGVRSQFIIVLLTALVLMFFLHKKTLRHTILFFILGVAAVITPMITRSLVLTGMPLIEDSGIHVSELSKRFSRTPNKDVSRLPDESDKEYTARQEQDILNFVLLNPAYTAGYITNHFLNGQISSALVLPLGLPLSLSAEDADSTYYHDVSTRMNSPEYAFARIFFGFFSALGLAACFKRCGGTALYPLFLSSAFMLSGAIFRYSGWRFILPADWFVYLYFAAGVFEAIYWIALRFRAQGSRILSFTAFQNSANNTRPWVSGLILGTLLICGSLPFILEHVIPAQLINNSNETNISKLFDYAALYGEPYGQIAEEAQKNGSQVINGRIIYPRYFGKNEGLTSANPWNVFKIRDFNRLSFMLLNVHNHEVLVPLSEPPQEVPNSSDVIVVGNWNDDGYFEGSLVIFCEEKENGSPRIIFSDFSRGLSHPK